MDSHQIKALICHIKRWTVNGMFAVVALWQAPIYLVPPIRYYNRFELQNFDYGILFHSTYLLSRFVDPIMRVRGVHVWADNQDYFQVFLSIVHYLPASHHLLLLLHSIVVFSVGLFCYAWLRGQGLLRLAVPVMVWLSPQMTNMAHDVVHTEAFATLIILLMFAFATKGRILLFFCCLMLAIICKEDIVATVGCFCILAFVAHTHFNLNRYWFALGLIVCVVLSIINLTVVLPYFKYRSCLWLDPDFAATVDIIPASPYFQNLTHKLSSIEFYAAMATHPDTGPYLVKLMWPLIPFAVVSFPFVLGVLPGAAINIFSLTGYFMEAYYHYDHSTYAALLIVVLIGARRVRWKNAIACYLIIGSIWIQFSGDHRQFKTPSREVFKRHFWDLKKSTKTKILEALHHTLPSNTRISADYNSIIYLLGDRIETFMLSNPFAPSYFGIYGLCERPKNQIPIDIVVIRNDYEISKATTRILSASFHYVSIGNGEVNVYVNRELPQYSRLLSRVKEVQRAFKKI
jgi:uncharacterized membrane protein